MKFTIVFKTSCGMVTTLITYREQRLEGVQQNANSGVSEEWTSLPSKP